MKHCNEPKNTKWTSSKSLSTKGYEAVSWSLSWNLFTAENVKMSWPFWCERDFGWSPPSQLAKNHDDNDDSRDPSQRDWATKKFNQRDILILGGGSSQSANGYLVVFWWFKRVVYHFLQIPKVLPIPFKVLRAKIGRFCWPSSGIKKPPVPHWLTPVPQRKYFQSFQSLTLLRRSFLISHCTRFQLHCHELIDNMDSPNAFFLSNMVFSHFNLREQGMDKTY